VENSTTVRRIGHLLTDGCIPLSDTPDNDELNRDTPGAWASSPTVELAATDLALDLRGVPLVHAGGADVPLIESGRAGVEPSSAFAPWICTEL
jgi:hypothetical protein